MFNTFLEQLYWPSFYVCSKFRENWSSSFLSNAVYNLTFCEKHFFFLSSRDHKTDIDAKILNTVALKWAIWITIVCCNKPDNDYRVEHRRWTCDKVMYISCGLKGFTQVRPLICQEVRLGVITVVFSRSAGGYCNSDRDILRVQTEPMSPISTCPTRHYPRVWVIRLCPIIASRQPHIVKPKKALMVVSDKLFKWHIFFFARFVSYFNKSDFSSLHNLWNTQLQ